MAIAPELAVILADLANLTAVSNNIAQELLGGSNAAKLKTIQQTVSSIAFSLQSPYTGLSAILADLADIKEQLVTLGAPQQANRPVLLPTTPPAGYGGPSLGDIGDEVWNYPVVNAPVYSMGEAMGALTSLWYSLGIAQAGFRSNGWSGYRIAGEWSFFGATFSGPTVPNLDFSTIASSDATILAWANRVYPATTWRNNGQGCVFEIDTGNFDLRWQIDLTQAEFEILKATAVSSRPAAAPVWPGLAAVVLGAPVAITTGMAGLTVNGPMNGVITAITTVASPTGYYLFDTDRSYVHLGGIAFQSDDGQDEEAQPMTFTAQVITPRAMASAAAAKVRVKTGTVGTITPWTFA